MHRQFVALIAASTFLVFQTTSLQAQETDEAAAADAPAADEGGEQAAPAPDAAGPARAKWNEAFEQWKGILSSLRDIQNEYELAESGELAGLQEQWQAKLDEGRQLIPDIRAAAIAAQREAPNSDRELTRFLMKMMQDEVDNDNYEVANELGKALIETNIDDRKIQDLAGIAAFAMSEFDRAAELLEQAEGTGTLTTSGTNFLSNLREHTNLAELWDAELQLRDAEAEAPEEQQLPQVKIETTAGDFVLELFENEAPETVGNFINLIEKGFYDNLTFHRVKQGFMAQGGCPNGDGSGGPGYKIFCECVADNHRNHWRGSVSMAKTPARNTGGSQFFFNFVPTPHLNGEHTVFGRIVEGTENLTKILKHDPSEPNKPATKIIKAEVLRKRDHDYVPNKV